MRIACLADTHGRHLPEIPAAAEAVIMAGDVGPNWKARQWFETTFAHWAEGVGRPIFLTWGNHDRIGEAIHVGAELPLRLPPSVRIVVDNAVRVGDTLVHFTPWTPVYESWAWMDTETELARYYRLIDPETAVVVSHGPPHGACDVAIRKGVGYRAGSPSLRDRFLALPKAQTLICGHIHEGRGEAQLAEGKTVVNCAVLDRRYDPVPEAVPVLTI